MCGGLLLAASGCASLTTGDGRGALPPTPIAALDPRAATTPTSPQLYWLPEWRIYLREGDVVEHGDRYYSYRSGRWHVSESPAGPWPGPAGGATPERKAVPPLEERSSTIESAPRDAVATVAMKYVGTPYAWGGTSPAGFDCSGFVQYVYAKLGVPLPRTAREQYGVGIPVSRDALAVGDVVFFDRLRHNGIYIGDGRFIHAARSGDAVKVSALDEGWFRQRWVGARRLPAGRPLVERSGHRED